MKKLTKAEEEQFCKDTGQTVAEFKRGQDALKRMVESGQGFKLSDIFKQKTLGDCVSANTSAFYFHLTKGSYPTDAKIPPNISPDEMVGTVDHQFVQFKKNVKRAYDWKLIQGTIINRLDGLPMAHCWCEATLDDMGGLYQRHKTLDGRFVFDFTRTEIELFFKSVYELNMINRIPLEAHKSYWEGNEHHYHRFEYNPEEASVIIQKNIGTWKFYEFDADAIDAELRNI